MRANNLTISIPTPPCTKGCRFCVSNMTYPVKENLTLFKHNLRRVRKLAERTGVTHILLTSKGEPMDNLKMVEVVYNEFAGDFPMEIQIHSSRFTEFVNSDISDFDIVSLSVEDPADMEEIMLWRDEYWGLKRMAVILNKAFDGYKLGWFLEECKRMKVDQLTIRQPTVPKNIIDTARAVKTAAWIHENSWPLLYEDNIVKELNRMIETGEARKIRDLLFGAVVYDINGIGFTHMEYCVESQNGEVMRSLIYQTDGHLYTTWDHKGSIIF